MERMGEMYGNRGGPPMSERRGCAASAVGCRRTWREGKRDRKGREVRGRRGREREREEEEEEERRRRRAASARVRIRVGRKRWGERERGGVRGEGETGDFEKESIKYLNKPTVEDDGVNMDR